MEWESLDTRLGGPAGDSLQLYNSCPSSAESRITEYEFSCHCCYDILVNPTTLTCGHNFCRHCLAQWWESSHKNECPECREKWEGFPKVNILLRYGFHICATVKILYCVLFFIRKKLKARLGLINTLIFRILPICKANAEPFCVGFLIILILLSEMPLKNFLVKLFVRGEKGYRQTPKSPEVYWPSRGNVTRCSGPQMC